MLKAELRKLYLKKRRELAHSERDIFSKQISNNFFSYFDLTQVSTIHIYISISEKFEFDTSLIYKRIWKDFGNIKTVAPRVNTKLNELENVQFTAKTKLIPNSWQIPEPIGDTFIATQEIDLVIVPLLCFDLTGHRVGYGKGFYDQMLGQCMKNCLKVGLGFFPPVLEIGDLHKKDVTLDYCVTPDKVYKF